jgi:Flp pilus assembly CpaE family ATPase
VLERADRIILVVAGDPVGLRRGIGAYEALRRDLPGAAAPIEIVLNHVQPTRAREAGAAIAHHLGLPVIAAIGVDRHAHAALWRGCLTNEVARRSPVWTAARALASRWVA